MGFFFMPEISRSLCFVKAGYDYMARSEVRNPGYCIMYYQFYKLRLICHSHHYHKKHHRTADVRCHLGQFASSAGAKVTWAGLKRPPHSMLFGRPIPPEATAERNFSLSTSHIPLTLAPATMLPPAHVPRDLTPWINPGG